MNIFPLKKARAVIVAALPSPRADRPHAVWTRDPKTGRLVQTWRHDPDGSERSCTGRLSGPPDSFAPGGLRRAA